MSDQKTDEELMIAYALGDETAFQKLYQRHSGRVLAFLKSKISDGRAYDVFQSTFMKLHRSRSNYRRDVPFIAWLFTICRSELLDAIKEEKRSIRTINEFAAEPVLAGNLGDIDLSSLTPEQQALIKLRFHDELSFDQIADRLGLSPVNVRQRISRIFRKLRGKTDGKK